MSGSANLARRLCRCWPIVILLGGVGCGDPLLDRVHTDPVTSGGLTIHTRYALPPFRDAPMAVYLTIDNTATIPDSFQRAESPLSREVMLHGAGMAMVSALEIPAGGSRTLAPGGQHLMLEPPLPMLGRGDSVQVTLHFARAGPIPVWVVVIGYDDLDRMRTPR